MILPSTPWRRADRLRLLATTATGVALVGVCWFGAAGATAVGTQVAWVNGGVVGVVILGAGNALWLLRGRRAAGRLRRAILDSDALARRLTTRDRAVDGRTNPLTAAVSGRPMTRYHRSDCPLVAGKKVSSATVATHRRRGRRPCGVCRPDGVAGAEDDLDG